MSLVNALIGNASEVEAAHTQKQFAQLFVPDEHVERAFQLIRDMFIFTNRRLIFVRRQGLSGKKVEYLSLPYRNIARFSIETAGPFDLEAELKIWLTGTVEPIQMQFSRKLNIYTVQQVLASYVAR